MAIRITVQRRFRVAKACNQIWVQLFLSANELTNKQELYG